ncbi:hypothetical protein MMC06_005196 [Schaereria dolodes]|nr:hypothetical protein [Schaereria dolodes]
MFHKGAKRLHVLFAQDGLVHLPSFPKDIVTRLGGIDGVEIKHVSHPSCSPQSRPAGASCWAEDLDSSLVTNTEGTLPLDAEELSGWADFLVVAPIAADTMSKMLHGLAENPLLEILRSWDVSKKILVVPGMSVAMWDNPMTKKQLSKIQRKWKWIRVLEPALWNHKQEEEKDICDWDGLNEVIRIVENQADLLTLGHDMNTNTSTSPPLLLSNQVNKVNLPAEIWSIILEHVGDWEMAKALGIYTSLETPKEWYRPCTSDQEPLAESQKLFDLDWAMLTGKYLDVTRQVEASLPLKWLSKLSVKIIIKFARTDILSYLENCQPDLFWSTFGHKLLPTKASAIFGQIAVLDWWRTSPSFLTKEYDADTIDGASKSGFVHVLDWWRKSSLPIRYTEASLEQASSKGNIDVLEWWRNAAILNLGGHEYHVDADAIVARNRKTNIADHSNDISYGNNARYLTTEPKLASPPPLRLKIGKSLIFAAQNGQAATLHWWSISNLPMPHEEGIARIASAFGHINVLDAWKAIKGDKMQFDNQILAGATKNGHSEVLEWWKRSGFRVEYKTCDVEEALEDCLGGRGEQAVRAWWAKNGLNLGVGTSEWMMVKVL